MADRRAEYPLWRMPWPKVPRAPSGGAGARLGATLTDAGPISPRLRRLLPQSLENHFFYTIHPIEPIPECQSEGGDDRRKAVARSTREPIPAPKRHCRYTIGSTADAPKLSHGGMAIGRQESHADKTLPA